MLKGLTALLPYLLLAGCATTGVTPVIERALPVESMQACVDLEELDASTSEALKLWIAKVVPQYESCAAGKKNLIEWIKRGNK